MAPGGPGPGPDPPGPVAPGPGTAPPPPGPTPELDWAQALDEAYNLLCRYSMAGGDARPTVWRRMIRR